MSIHTHSIINIIGGGIAIQGAGAGSYSSSSWSNIPSSSIYFHSRRAS